MPKYLVRWKMNPHKFPTDPQEQGELMTRLFQMVKDDSEKGICLDWVMFPETDHGISFTNASAEELSSVLMK